MPLRPIDEVSRRESWWVRLQQLIGLLPLTLFAGFHLWMNWAALAGRDVWLDRVRAYALARPIGEALLALFGLHALLGLVRVLRRQRAPRDGRAGFQAFTGGALAFFLAYHLTHVWPRAGVAHSAFTDSYERLWQLLGRPIPLTVYMLGSAALAFHLAHGWTRVIEAYLPRMLRSLAQYAAGVAGLALFFFYLQLVGWFALGEAVIPSLAPTHGLDTPSQHEPGR
ncbi:MAG TPA: hypothetical protein VGI70_10650 [Polyangiales bacterium]|jgi:succinate dehydrogenase hydrophobic anchor subunit